ncbi:MAG: phenylalanine--tRNA ligase subunit beta [Succinivibrionaceae bacterium]
MRFNKLWLDELVPNTLSADDVSEIITMAGLEVDTVDNVTGSFTNVVVGEVLSCEDHPDSDHLHVTKVNVGNEVLDIVCGAPNCRTGLKVACAKVGAVLPGDFKIKPAKLRGVPSNGMLCSYKELGLCEEGSGIIEFPSDAPIGVDIHDYLKLNDKAIEVDLTANRSDCLSIKGIAREFGVLTKTDVEYINIQSVPPTINDTFLVEVADKRACPRYVSRVLKNLDITKPSPIWMQEKLRRCGIRSIDAIVDVTNYVMLSLGQPMHAFDLDSLSNKIVVRQAQENEQLVLLSEAEAKLSPNTLVISDDSGAIALAGIFGGAKTGVKKDTKNILLESAFFAPSAIKNRARSYGLATDASHRFERGVDYNIQKEAIEYATTLLLEICGGEAGPVSEQFSPEFLPKSNDIQVSFDLIKEVIGIEIPKDTVLDILTRLGLEPRVSSDNSYVTVTSPSWRYDIAIPVDICEEVARIYGYDNIPNLDPIAPLRMVEKKEATIETYDIKLQLADLGYHEVVTYSFVDAKSLSLLNPQVSPISIPSPISAEMSTMRTTLWAGLVNAVTYNVNRQASRLKLFETGLVFIPDTLAENGIRQDEMVGGIVYGNFNEESWNVKNRPFDFYDIKGDVEKLLGLTAKYNSFTFTKCDIPALHPGVSATICKDGEVVGYVGLVHPSIEKKLGLKHSAFMFEILASALKEKEIPVYSEISKFPSNRRDFAVVLDKNAQASDLVNCVKKHGGKLIQAVNVFDVYEGDNLPEDKKSIALSVTIQAVEKTLSDEEINTISDSIIKGLTTDLSAQLRE